MPEPGQPPPDVQLGEGKGSAEGDSSTPTIAFDRNVDEVRLPRVEFEQDTRELRSPSLIKPVYEQDREFYRKIVDYSGFSLLVLCLGAVILAAMERKVPDGFFTIAGTIVGLLSGIFLGGKQNR